MGKSFRIMESKPFYQNGTDRRTHTALSYVRQCSFPDERLLKELNALSDDAKSPKTHTHRGDTRPHETAIIYVF